MTDQEINITVAEACGWEYKEVFEPSFSNLAKLVSRGHKWHNPNGFQAHLPDFTTDLNACHEMEKLISNPQLTCAKAAYADILDSLVNPKPNFSSNGLITFSFIHATARQRAEAFLRILGKWKE